MATRLQLKNAASNVIEYAPVINRVSNGYTLSDRLASTHLSLHVFAKGLFASGFDQRHDYTQ